MNEVSAPLARWLEQKRRTDRTSAAVIAVLALGGGLAVFLLTTLLIYAVLAAAAGAFVQSHAGLVLIALGLTAVIFVRGLKITQDKRQLELDPMGYWIYKDIASIGPRLMLEGLRQVRCYGLLGELHVAACARALDYLARQDTAITWQELLAHCPQLPSRRLREELSLLDGVLFLGEDGARVTLMDPFRLRLRPMLGHEPTQPRPERAPEPVPVYDPEMLSAYEILGLSPSASAAEIKAAYRKRVKECHPDLFAGMDQQARALAERWTRALNAAYATLKPRHEGAKPSSTAQR